jgi:hypothetical protein
MKLVSLSLLITGVLGAVSQYCAGFEDSKKPRQLTVRVGSDTSVLMYHIADISSSNIPMIIDDQVLRLEPNGFSICTESKASQGHCDAVGTFMVKFDDTRHHLIINKFAYAGEKVNLTISKEGLYCVVTYQQRTKLSHIKVVEKHSYGYLPLPLYEKMKVFYLLGALLIITLCALKFSFKCERRALIGTISQDISILLSAKTAQILSKILVLSVQNLSGTKDVDLKAMADAIYTEITFIIYYKLSSGIFGIKEEEMAKIQFEPFFRIWMFFMLLGVTLLYPKPLPQGLISLELYAAGFLSGIARFIIWIYVVNIMWKNSKITLRKIVDPVFAKKYQRSRLCLISIPVAVCLVSFGGVVIVMSAISNGYYSRLGDFGKDMKGNFIFVLESSLSQNYFFVLLRHLYEFSILFVQWAFLFIWNFHLIDRTGFKDFHNSELADGSGDIRI